MPKSEEYLRLESVGIPVPRWEILSEHHRPDLSEFSKYIISKPNEGGRGAEVKIRRKSRVRWKPIDQGVPKATSELLVQEFVYTGRWPVSYRVVTLCGKALCAWRTEADRARRPLEGIDRFADGAEGGGMSIVSTGKGCQFKLSEDREVIALAERAHAAFPSIPLLGVDVIREQPSGQLYVIEVNACGQTWHFNSPKGQALQQEFGFCLETQFDAMNLAADVLIEQARRLAC